MLRVREDATRFFGLLSVLWLQPWRDGPTGPLFRLQMPRCDLQP